MHSRPFEHYALYLRRKVALIDLQCFNIYRGFMTSAFDMEVRLPMVSPMDSDHDSIEAADLRHGRLGLVSISGTCPQLPAR